MNDTNILPSNEYKEVENRLYLNPNLQVTETSDFIDKLRETQRGNNLQIAQQTQALGTDVPTSLGGLTGAGSYFTSRYQTPQTNSMTQTLRTTTRAAALNQALANEQNVWKKRYDEAFRNHQKRSWNKSDSTTPSTTIDDVLEETVTEEDGTKKVTATTEELSRQMYLHKIQDYVNSGMNIVDATNRVKAELGLD